MTDEHKAEIERLAALEPDEYEMARAGAAAYLGVSKTDLDEMVDRARNAQLDQVALSGDGTAEDMATIARLAALTPLAFDRIKKEEAANLGCDVTTLQREVKKARGGDGKAGQGRRVEIKDVDLWPEPVDGHDLADNLVRVLHRFIVLPAPSIDAIALWVLATWLVETFGIAPRLAVTSPLKGCGKTTVLDVLSAVTRRPKRLGSASGASLFRVIEAVQPCLLMDETEKHLHYGSEEHAILNEGHARGSTVMRVLGDKLELYEFYVFAFVAFAMNTGKQGRTIPDDLCQRSIVVEMQRRKRDEPAIEGWSHDGSSAAELQPVASQCARWAKDNAEVVRKADPDMGDLINRTADNWRVIFRVAEVAGGDWPARARRAARALIKPDTDDDTGLMLLSDIADAFVNRQTDRIASDELPEVLHAIEGRPWNEYGRQQKPITKNQIAALLKPFAISSGSIREDGRPKTRKGYYRRQFEEVWARYLPPSETAQRHTPTETRVSDDSETAHVPDVPPVVPFHNGPKASNPNGCAVVSFPTQKDCGEPVGVGCPPIPAILDRTGKSKDVCDHCGQPERPDDPVQRCHDGREYNWLHRSCQAAWMMEPSDLQRIMGD